MNDTIEMARFALLQPAGLTDHQVENILGKMLGRTVDYADMYFQTSRHESWVLEDGIIKESVFDINKGVGLRVISGEKTGFAYSDDVDSVALEQAAVAARSITSQGGKLAVPVRKIHEGHHLYPILNPLDNMQDTAKIQLLHDVNAQVRRQSPYVSQVTVSLSGVHEVVLILNSEGEWSADIRPLVRLNVSVLVEKNGRRESGYTGGGGRLGYQYFLENNRALEYANEAVKQALINLEAIHAPVGMMPVVLGAGWPGVLLHEAIGHGLEGDFNRKNTSAFSGRLGERVAAPGVTVVDDGTLPNRRGSLNIDDEGTPTQCTVLIENGILKGYMQDKLNARLMNMPATGNGRRESYAHLPIPRMTNTYMLPGQYAPEEILASVDKGIYAVNFAGGQVDITSGKFVFSTSEAYLIENGRVTTPIKGATLIGNGPDVLTRVSMVGKDLKLDSGIGVCGKDGQSVPVGVGQPTLRIDGLTVGGVEQ